VTGIAAMFLELSQPDLFAVQVQLELFAWRTKAWQREHDRWRNRLRRADLRRWKRDHWKRVAADPVRIERRREYNRQWMADRRARAT
jgi:hypothetical protein